MWRAVRPAHSVGMRNVVKFSPMRLYNRTAKLGGDDEIQSFIAISYS